MSMVYLLVSAIILIAIVIVFLIVKFQLKQMKNIFLTSLFVLIIVILLDSNWSEMHTVEGQETLKVPQSEYSFIKIKDQVKIDTPVVSQLPELPRGCEVTSLAMLLHSAGVQADKMELAAKVKKNPAKMETKNGNIYYGDPENGFVGDMYTFEKPGLGVYHEPIMELAEAYLPGQIVNLTGQTFEELKIPLSAGRPVWVIINTEYRKLEDSYFQTWHTESGKIHITRKEHSVLITGYDQHFVYFNDPLTGKKNKKAAIKDFEQSWLQMGSQALTYSGE
ncbi:C39 family peptidase [Bacillus sp. J14TS2]|uniref:C39 family peptidase n=1 Tax=Bacillus sp. J14TS2 TaxID=2807188 RepID=UPI0035B54CD0